MLNLKFGDKEYGIKFAYEPTLKCGLVNKLVKSESDNLTEDEAIDVGLMMLPEMLLVGLQSEHRAEFGFNYSTGEGKDEQMSKVFAMLDDYFADENSDFSEIYNALQEEMLNNGFLAAMFRQTIKAAEQKKSQRKK